MESVMDFSDALKELRNGKLLTRKGWNGNGQYIALQTSDEHSKMTQPYLYFTSGTTVVPWVASQTDLLNDDWEVTESGQS
jgi:hypothetical protein